MIEQSNAIVTRIENDAGIGDRDAAIAALRQLGLADFGLALLQMPDPYFPRLSSLLPRMAADSVQDSWTGNHGVPLLIQSCAFVRMVADRFCLETGRTLRGQRMLDFGCGYGRIARLMYFYSDYTKLVGVDPWIESIRICREDGLGSNFLLSDWLPERLPVDGRFDLIYAFSVFTHLSFRATSCALRTLRRYLEPDGLLAITVRPKEYWALGQSACAQVPHAELEAVHEREGFVFVPHHPAQADDDTTYGDTSMSVEWLRDRFPEWRVAGTDRSLVDPYQLCVFLQQGK